MTPHFTPAPDSSVTVRLEEYEADILRGLIGELRAVLDLQLKGDEVLERLFPRAFESDADEDNYRGLVREDLSQAKNEALRAVASGLGPSGEVEVTLPRAEIDAWLTLLTDLRLAVGTRLDITEEKMAAEVDPGQKDATSYTVLHWLGWMQESMLAELDPMSPQDAERNDQ